MEIPEFHTAVLLLREFLAEQDLPTDVLWIFREDLYFADWQTVYARTCALPGHIRLAETVFQDGRKQGLVEICGLFRTQSFVGATVWYPRNRSEQVQGWTQGLKISVREPLRFAKPIRSSTLWRFHQCRPKYKRYQARECFVHLRSSVSIQQPDATSESTRPFD
jgi:hypothetical protein